MLLNCGKVLVCVIKALRYLCWCGVVWCGMVYVVCVCVCCVCVLCVCVCVHKLQIELVYVVCANQAC